MEMAHTEVNLQIKHHFAVFKAFLIRVESFWNEQMISSSLRSLVGCQIIVSPNKKAAVSLLDYMTSLASGSVA